MTNIERWNLFTSGLTSPQNYLDWTWRSIVTTALSRRVWLPPDDHPCFANSYTVLVGDAGLGKDLATGIAKDFLSHWRLKDSLKLDRNGSVANKEMADLIAASDLKLAKEYELQCSENQNDVIEPGLIPVAADTTTYEAFVRSIAKSIRRVNYIKYNEQLAKNELKTYGCSATVFVLKELASLLRKDTDDIVNFMLGLYDCPLDYIYDTKNKGKDRIRRGCLNLLAGTTPSFLQTIFNEKLIDQGFASRTHLIYASKERERRFFLPQHTEEQKRAKLELLEHIRKLTILYGCIEMDKPIIDWLENWWQTYENKNRSPKLKGWRARFKVHVMKTAMAEHFSEHTELYIPLETYQKAIEILEKEEKTMHLAVVMQGENILQKVATRLLDLLANGPLDQMEIFKELYHIANIQQQEEAISFLVDTDQIKLDRQEKDEITMKTMSWWRIK